MTITPAPEVSASWLHPDVLRGDQDLAAHVAALLGAGLLVLHIKEWIELPL